MGDTVIQADKPKNKIEYTIETTMALSEDKQQAIIGHMILDGLRFSQCMRKLEPGYFVEANAALVFKIMMELFKKNQLVPSETDIKDSPQLSVFEHNARNKIHIFIDICKEKAGQYRFGTMTADLTAWLHSKILQDTVERSVHWWNNGKFADVADQMALAVKACREAKFEDGLQVSFENFQDYIKKEKEERKDALQTGLSLLDQALGANGPKEGGLHKGDSTVILAPSNAGKTTTIITTVVHNVKQGRSVFFMTHEGRPDDIRLKLLKCFLGVSQAELFAMYEDSSPGGGQAKIVVATQYLSRFLVYMPYNKAGMTVEDVMPIIDRVQEERKMKNNGAGFDMFASDYPAKLGTVMASKGHMPPRLIVEAVYENYVQKALENNWHSIVAIQTNRSGSSLNNSDEHNHRLLEMEDVAEAWGPMTSASNVITLNRSPLAKQENKLTLYVAKSRSSSTGVAVMAKTDFASCISHSESLGAVAYRGSHTREESLETFFALNLKNRWMDKDTLKSDAKAFSTPTATAPAPAQ